MYYKYFNEDINWLLIYEIVEDKLILILLALSSHSELF